MQTNTSVGDKMKLGHFDGEAKKEFNLRVMGAAKQNVLQHN